MNDTPLVRVLQRPRDVCAIADGIALSEPSLRIEDLAQRVSVHVLHHEVMPRPKPARVVHSHDIGVLQPRDDPRFAFETLHEIAVVLGPEALTQYLYRDPPFEPLVFREPYFGNASRSNEALNAISSVYDVGWVHRQMTLRTAALPLTSRQRNIELLLLAGSLAFILLAWRALDAAGFTMPPNASRILSQFLLTAVAGHIALRVLAPGAAGQPYAIALLLSAVGLAFVMRLSPDSAQSQVNWITFGIVLMCITAWAASRYERLRAYKYTAALIAVALLIATGLFGTTINGARLWFTIAGQSIQTTELIKLFLLVFLAGYLADEAAVLSAPRMRCR